MNEDFNLEARLLKIRAVMASDSYPRTDSCKECGRKYEMLPLPPRSPELSARAERALNLGMVNKGHDIPVNAEALAAISKALVRTIPWQQRIRLALRQWLFALAHRVIACA